jgi:hypothetical protein
MEVHEVVMLAGMVLAGGIFLWLLWRSAPKTELVDQVGDIETAIIFARELVLAAEQLWETGQIEKGDRFDYVMGKLMMVFPDLDIDTLEALLEAAVKWGKIIAPKAEAIIVDLVEPD